MALYSSLDEMTAAAIEVLRRNDLGGWTKAAPRLYPHQWSWDSAFIAIGLAHVDTARAAQELRSLFAAQWATGLLPHIVFNPDVPPESYYPDAECWNVANLSADVPAGKLTSGLIQPPVHAIAAWRIREVAERRSAADGAAADAFLREIYPRLFAWHRYLLTARDPEASGLVTIYHPWESGLDNSPRWDSAMAAIEVGELEPYTRFDLQHVPMPRSARPTRSTTAISGWSSCSSRLDYDDAVVEASGYPFLVKDVLISGILVAANECAAPDRGTRRSIRRRAPPDRRVDGARAARS